MRLIYILACVLVIGSCVEEIDLNIDTDRSFVAVDGIIADELQEYVINVRNSAVIGVGNDNILTPISGASVQVVSDEGERIDFIEDQEQLGSYKQTMQGEVGRSYHVEINLLDGRQIVSDPAEIAARVEIDSLDFTVTSEALINNSGNVVTQEMVNVFLSTTVDDTDRPFLRWRAEGQYEFQEIDPSVLFPDKCYVSEQIDINNLQIFDARELNGTVLFEQPLFSTLFNRRFNVIYCAHIRQMRISEQEFNYWGAVDQLINIDGTLFDPPPASIRGNLRNVNDEDDQIFGYFSVVSQASTRFFIDVTQQGFIADTNCSPFTFRMNPPECANCTLIANSTRERPAFWPF